MVMKKLVCLLALSLSFSSSLASAAQKSAAEQQQKTARGIETKAIAVLDSVVADAQLLNFPANRIRVRIQAADLLWKHDEKRARGLIKDVTNSFDELLVGKNDGEPDYREALNLVFQLRHEVLYLILRHDAELALDFLRATRQPAPPPSFPGYQQPDFDAQLEIRLAAEIAAKDTRQALKIAEEAMERGLSSDLGSLLSRLQDKDPEAAATLASSIIGKLRSENLEADAAGMGVAFDLLRRGLESTRAASRREGSLAAGEVKRAIVDEQAVRELMDLVLGSLLRAISNGGGSRVNAWSFLGSLQPMISDVERYAPSRVPEIRKRLAVYNMMNAQAEERRKYQDLLQNGTVQALLEALKEASPEVARDFYQQAAWRAFNSGDINQARAIVDSHFTDPVERKQMMANFDQQLLWRAAQEGKLIEARQMLSRIPSIEWKLNFLIQLGAAAAQRKDKKLALEFFDEARALIDGRAESYSQLNGQLQLANAYAPLEPMRSFDLIEQIISRLNENLAAAAVLDGFEVYRYFKNGELVLESGRSLVGTIQECSRVLGLLARSNFDRASSAAERFDRSEVRLLGRISIAEAVLSDSSATNYRGLGLMVGPVRRFGSIH